MKPLTIEIHGTGTHNRGAELMAIAIKERVNMSFPGARIVVGPDFGSLEDIRKYGFRYTRFFSTRRFNYLRTLLFSLRVLSDNSLVDPKEIDVVLDASGFQFSDQWSHRPAKNLFNKMNECERRNQVLVILPQAFGPFRTRRVEHWVRKLFSRATLIFARDDESYCYGAALHLNTEIRRSPDFTIAVEPSAPVDLKLPENFAAIVPNFRMLDKSLNPSAYLQFLRHSVEAMESNGIAPVIVLHDSSEDLKVLKRLGPRYSSLPVYSSTDPKTLKGILGKAKFVIGSRFHALVSSLSQGVPCLAVGWSHKYPELFKDFECDEFLLENLEDVNSFDLMISKLSNQSFRDNLSDRISKRAEALKAEVDHMWLKVESEIIAVCPRYAS